MPFIRVLASEDLPDLVSLAQKTFLESHGHSASKADIEAYLESAMKIQNFQKEMQDEKTYFHLLYHEEYLIGYSKIKIFCPYPKINETNISKLERIYVLESYLGKGFGQFLLNFNINLAKNLHQKGIWLYTWIENHLALAFYKKNGFMEIDHRDFKLSENHSNPNYILWKSLDEE